jgi:hypothetical protein
VISVRLVVLESLDWHFLGELFFRRQDKTQPRQEFPYRSIDRTPDRLPLAAILRPARRQVNAERRVTPERDAAEGILFDVFE